MPPELIARYSPGGDIYMSFAQTYGEGSAQRVYRAAQSGDRGAVAAAISEAKFGSPLNDSTASILAEQVLTDPLGAPLDAANKGITTIAGNTFKALFRNPAVLIVLFLIGLGIAVYFFGLPKSLKKSAA